MISRYYDVSIYRYGDERKIVYFKRSLGAKDKRYSTVEEIEPEKIGDKFLNNIIRAKSNVLALGLCNPWDYFCTFTLDRLKYDRFNLSAWRKDFSQYIRDQRKSTGAEFAYILIPELHQDGAWHMHGLIKGYSWNRLKKFDPKVHPLKLCTSDYRYHEGILQKFGFNSFGRIKNQSAVSRYLIKYIRKDMASVNIALGYHLYYSSQGLQRPEIVASGCTSSYLTNVSFSNDFMACDWISKEEADRLLRYIL